MSKSSFYVSIAAIRNLKKIAVKSLPSVSSSHWSEGVAAALGFNTYAALSVALAGHSTLQVQKPDNALLIRRLRQLGYQDISDNFHILPEFDQSYLP